MGTTAEFRQYAQECVELANATDNAPRRKMLLDMAVQWLKLADARRHEIALTTQPDKRAAPS